METQTDVPENVEESLDHEIEVEITEHNDLLSAKITEGNNEVNQRKEHASLQIEDDQPNDETQINEPGIGDLVPVSQETNLVRMNDESTAVSETQHDIPNRDTKENKEDDHPNVRRMNNAISLGKSFLTSTLGVAGVVFTGIGNVMTAAANIVGEDNGKSSEHITTTNIQNNIKILVLQNNTEPRKQYNAKNKRNYQKLQNWKDQPCKNGCKCRWAKKKKCKFNH